ncbi:YczE/YyaS/YitT family protein [Culicoidibacter larvae]|uniref:YitT family protein n=1 Tax=Culicoidibacter larvae TaxID=2579976 RepID=A0A5R8QB88_9FIRM|nr:hypothetical protein [Culicoidibacter larvae]TLG73849.1 hypothetical protein FEZ08_06860 [Culicoidibacter larvae]
MNKYLSLTLRILVVIGGTFVSAVGIKFFLMGGMGVDPISTFLLGIMNYVPIEFGTASQLFSVVVIGIMFFLERKHLGIGSIINGLGIGFFINIINIGDVTLAPIYQFAYLDMIIGPLLLGIGIGIYLSANLGGSSLECLMTFFAEKTKFHIRYVRIALDLTLVVLGIIMGAQFGIGTFLGVICIGPVVSFTMMAINSIRKKLKTA